MAWVAFAAWSRCIATSSSCCARAVWSRPSAGTTLRRELPLAEVERRHDAAQAARARFDALGRRPETARLEARLAQLERRISDGKGGVRDPEDLETISLQQRQAFYRCE